jgi:hypothetical protein
MVGESPDLEDVGLAPSEARAGDPIACGIEPFQDGPEFPTGLEVGHELDWDNELHVIRIHVLFQKIKVAWPFLPMPEGRGLLATGC